MPGNDRGRDWNVGYSSQVTPTMAGHDRDIENVREQNLP